MWKIHKIMSICQICTVHPKIYIGSKFFVFLQLKVYRDAYRIVSPVSWYVSYHEVTVLFHPYITP